MKNVSGMQKYVLLFLLTATYSIFSKIRPPKLTVIIVIDQFSFNYIQKLYPHLRGGLKYLLDTGVSYTNAYHPHGLPVTSTGHAALNTGTYAHDHGIIGNYWYINNRYTCSDDDTNPETYVLSPDGVYDFGKSPHFLMTDGLTDQYILQSQPESLYHSCSISFKSQPAVMTASRLGKAIWFDNKSGNFTSSKAYYQELPEWIHRFNKKHNPNNLKNIHWQRMFPKSKHAYNFFLKNNYLYASQYGLVDTTIPVINQLNPQNPYHLYEKTPHANKILIELAKKCIAEHVNHRSHDRLLLWLCLSPLDLLGHEYGPDSLEVIDMIYHIDRQLRKFLLYTMHSVGKSNLLIALTADHGISKIPEIAHMQGLNAERIDPEHLVELINTTIKEKYAIDTIALHHAGREIYLNHSALAQLDSITSYAVIDDIKLLLLQQTGIKQVWTFNELYNLPTQPHSLEDNIKNQLFAGRSGDIIIQTYPHAVITDHAYGTTHETAYNNDTHVPLIFFQHSMFERRNIRQRVSTLQFANTMAELLHIPKPSASVADILPGLFDWDLQ